MKLNIEELAAEVPKILGGSLPNIFALTGNLGSGKTVFAQLVAKTLVVKEQVISPTFVIHRDYNCNYGNIRRFHHLDFYRIESKMELEELRIENLVGPQSLVIIEWADKFEHFLNDLAQEKNISIKWIHFAHVDETTREVILK